MEYWRKTGRANSSREAGQMSLFGSTYFRNISFALADRRTNVTVHRSRSAFGVRRLAFGVHRFTEYRIPNTDYRLPSRKRRERRHRRDRRERKTSSAEQVYFFY
jgi:hypothetical protein